MGHTSPITLLGPRLRAGVYTLGTYVQPPALPRVSVLTDFDEVVRNVSLPVTATVRLVRTPPFTDQCSVQWNVLGTGPTPITAAYFVPLGLPSGLATFQPGWQYIDITLTFSSGALPPTDLFGIFQTFGASGCTILASQSSFQFRLLEVPPYATPWQWDEPVWIPQVSYAAAPGKVQITTAAGLAQLATAQAGRTYVINGDIDGAGGSFTITAAGTEANPVRIIARDSVGNATLRNCAFTVESSSYLLVDGINFNNANFLLTGIGSFIQFQRNEFTNLNTKSGAVRISGSSRYRYMRIYGNEFGNLHGVPYNATGVTTSVIIPKVNNTNHWKYLWVERNFFKNFAPQIPGGSRHQAVFLGEANPDADKNTFTTFKENLILDSGDPAIWEMKLSGNMRIIGNTIERSSTAFPAVVAKIRFGSIKQRSGTMPTGALISAVGALIERNLFVTPGEFPCGGMRLKDAGHRIVHNAGLRLAPGEQPLLSSPLNGSTIGLGFGNMDMTWWPEIVADVPREERTGRYFINTGFNVVAGNKMAVEVGSEENSLHPGETLWPATDNVVSAASALRTDRNAAVTLFPPPRQVDTTTDVAVLGVDYNQVPVRILPSTCGRNAPSSPSEGYAPPGYTLVWFDEFDAYSVADWSVVTGGDHQWVPYFVGWGVRHLSGNSDEGIKVADYETVSGGGSTVKQLLDTEGSLTAQATYGRYLHDITPQGTLLMRAFKTPASLLTNFYGFPYIGSMISTERTYAQGYGYFECRFRILNFFAGLHFSIWMLSQTLEWPPEIDILEVVGNDPSTWYTNIHGEPVDEPLQSQTVPDYDQWHTLGFERTATQLKWYLDGVLFRTSANYISPANRPMFFVLTYEVGGTWEGDPAPTAPWPAIFEIDYAKAYTP